MKLFHIEQEDLLVKMRHFWEQYIQSFSDFGEFFLKIKSETLFFVWFIFGNCFCLYLI